jgi:hypothetical protein
VVNLSGCGLPTLTSSIATIRDVLGHARKLENVRDLGATGWSELTAAR